MKEGGKEARLLLVPGARSSASCSSPLPFRSSSLSLLFPWSPLPFLSTPGVPAPRLALRVFLSRGWVLLPYTCEEEAQDRLAAPCMSWISNQSFLPHLHPQNLMLGLPFRAVPKDVFPRLSPVCTGTTSTEQWVDCPVVSGVLYT